MPTTLKRLAEGGWTTFRRFVNGGRGIAETVRADLQADPYLRWLLAFAFVTGGAFIWYRVPNFAAPDEYARLLKPMKVVGRGAQDGLPGFQEGLLADRALGPTIYLNALALVPVLVAVVFTGTLGDLVGLGSITSRWDLWHAAPAWFWASSLLVARLFSLAFAIATVYVVYRTGVEAYDRNAGRYAAVLLALSTGFLATSREASEDAPLVFLTALVLYLGVRYVRAGDRRYFLAACALGGLATAFKFSGGITALLLGSAYLLNLVRTDPSERDIGLRILAAGFALAFIAFYLGFAAVVVGGPTVLYDRVANEFTRHVGGGGGGGVETTLPFFGYGVFLPYLNGLGLPLFVAAVGGVGASIVRAVRDRTAAVPEMVILPAFAGFVGVFLVAGEADTRHLIPTYPMALILLGGALETLERRRETVVRVAVAALLVTTSVYAGGAVLTFAQEPRDQATRTLASEVGSDAEVLVYENSIADIATVHGRPVVHYEYDEANATGPLVRNESAYTEWMTSSTEREPAVIQLTCRGAISYLLPNERARYPKRATFVDNLLFEDAYDYRRLATFGTAPSTYLDRRTTSPLRRLLAAGVYPNPGTTEPCVVLLEREG